MDKSTRGIVLHHIDHSESSIILKVLTPEEGLASFIWKGAKQKRKGGSFGSITLPLNRVELTAHSKRDGELQLLKEIRVAEPFRKVLYDPERSGIAIFIGEFLYRLSASQAPDPELFLEVEKCIEALDQVADPRDIHLHFLARAMLPNGIAPSPDPSGERCFDLLKGEFCTETPEHRSYLTPGEKLLLDRMLETGFDAHQRFIKGGKERQDLLRKLIEHYRAQLGDIGPIRSLDVLHELFAG